MKRRDLVIVTLPGDKPRPAVVVQADALMDSLTVLICPFTSGLEFASSYRVVVEPTVSNGLRSASVIMTEKLQAVRRDKCSDPIGFLGSADMAAINAQLAFVLGLSVDD